MRFGIAKKSSDDSGEDKKRDLPAELEPLGREEYEKVEERLNYKFKDLETLERAFTHRSVQQTRDSKADYERLEYLGDAVLDLAVAELLLDAHPTAREGELSKMRAALVNTSSLAEIGGEVGLNRFIRLSKGELASGGADRPSILADVFEAVMGAVYREAGFDVALKTAAGLFGSRIQTVVPRDPKTELQELLHATGSEPPSYLLECVEGPEHAPAFISVVEVDGQVVGRGKGPTKKASQQAAASEALERLRPDQTPSEIFFDDSENYDEGESDEKEKKEA